VSIFDFVALLSSPNTSRRNAAGVELYPIIRTLCARPNTPPRSFTPVLIPPRWREDVAQDVLLRLAEDGGAIVARMKDAGDGAAETYVRRMIAARYLTLVRRMREVGELDPGRIAAPAPAPVDQEDEPEQGRAVVESVLRRLDAPAEVRRTYEEMDALAAGRVTMEQCIERELGTTPTLAAFRTARNRLQQRHRRLRVSLLEAIEQLARDGALDAEDALLGARFVERVLNRAPKRRAPSDRRTARVEWRSAS
jgi:hypothetical protein